MSPGFEQQHSWAGVWDRRHGEPVGQASRAHAAKAPRYSPLAGRTESQAAPPSAKTPVATAAAMPASRPVLSTTDAAGTRGSVSYHLQVKSPQLGTVFNSRVYVPQGGMPTVTGDIDASEFTLTTGRAELSSFSDTILVSVSPGISEVDFQVTFDIVGQGKLTDVVGGVAELPDAPAAPLDARDASGANVGLLAAGFAAAAAAVAALGGGAWYTRRRWES